MTISSKKESFLLLLGDLFIFAISIWVSLAIRNGELPEWTLYKSNLIPFLIIFLAWIIVFFIAGLYDKYTTILKDKIPGRIFNAQLGNTVLAIMFFYFLPYFGVAPKTILFIDLIVSFVLIYIWRIYSNYLFGLKNKESAIIIGSGEEMLELEKEVGDNPRSALKFVSSIDLDKVSGIDFADEIVKRVYSENIAVIVVDLKDDRVEPILPHLYNLIFSGVKFVDMYKVYEDVFDREPLTLVRYNWFLENISTDAKITYDILKRAMDMVVGLVTGIISLIFYPFVILAIKLDDGGSVFIVQERVGKNNVPIKAYKFRTMKRNETDLSKGANNKVTRIGGFLRKSRIDELPQIWAVLGGSLSLIGPRPELPSGVALYEKEIPYYGIRHLIKPGLSGWAQLYHDNHPHHGFGVEQTKEKLSYDLYYLKNRSFMLDVQIGLKTIKKLLSRSGI
ncbi:MAG: sugar transferase [Candidatus Paceibacterota bacterium]|jgi:exopolysaccharide biosynthesis polyprenyl glycosylphosphotransferase